MTDPRDEQKRFDPRFDPAFQPGYDPRNDPAGPARGAPDRFAPQRFAPSVNLVPPASVAPRSDGSAASAFAPGYAPTAPGATPVGAAPQPGAEPVSDDAARASDPVADELPTRGVNPFSVALWVISALLVVGGVTIYRALPGLTEQSSTTAGAGSNFIQLFTLGVLGSVLVGAGLVAAVGNLLLLAQRFDRRR